MKRILLVLLLSIVCLNVAFAKVSKSKEVFLGNQGTEIALTDEEKMSLLYGELNLIDFRFIVIEGRINKLEAMHPDMDIDEGILKTSKLIKFFVCTGLTVWGFSERTGYGFVTGLYFGRKAGSHLIGAVYD